jgi:epoxyqueuosine reductase
MIPIAREAEDNAAANLAAEVKRQALALGFDSVGITTPDAIPAAPVRLAAFLEIGAHGDMDWLLRHADRRGDPRVLWPEVRSVVMLGTCYAPDCDPRESLADPVSGTVSVYAKGRDYHDVLKARTKTLARWLVARAGGEAKVFVDTAPLMEKPLAEAAGLGWQGKHTNLVSRAHGSWLFLAALLTDVPLPPDARETDHCGSCRRCLDICPTQAFPAPYQLDARRCIAYLTIEHKGHIAPEFREPIGNRVFGCDDCLAVCPWNRFAQATREARFKGGPLTDDPPLAELLGLDDAAFRARFAGTPLKRTGRDRFIRNCLIAAGNSGDPDLAPLVAGLIGDASPLVRAMAVWAYARLAAAADVAAAYARHSVGESDATVCAEWQTALKEQA